MALKPMSFEAQQILKRLEALAVSETVGWAALDKLVGRNVRHHYYWIRTAQAAMLRNGIVIEAEPGVGLRRINPEQHIAVGEKGLREARRKAGRSLRKMTALDETQWNGLTNEQKIRHNATASMLGAVRHFAGDKTVVALESKVKAQRFVFEPADAVKALGAG